MDSVDSVLINGRCWWCYLPFHLHSSFPLLLDQKRQPSENPHIFKSVSLSDSDDTVRSSQSAGQLPPISTDCCKSLRQKRLYQPTAIKNFTVFSRLVTKMWRTVSRRRMIAGRSSRSFAVDAASPRKKIAIVGGGVAGLQSFDWSWSWLHCIRKITIHWWCVAIQLQRFWAASTKTTLRIPWFSFWRVPLWYFPQRWRSTAVYSTICYQS